MCRRYVCHSANFWTLGIQFCMQGIPLKKGKAAEIIRIVQSCESGMAEDLSRAGEVDECCETWCKIRRSALAVASAAGSGICKQFLMVMRLLACEVYQQPRKFQIVSEP